MQTYLFESAIAPIVKQKIGHVVVADENVREAVIIVVGERHAHAAADVLADSGFFGDVLESAVAAVAVQRVGEALEIFGVAVHAQIAFAARFDIQRCGGCVQDA